jgi:hypothetical protein
MLVLVSSLLTFLCRISMNEGGSLNQIPHLCVIEGDIRLIPFYKISDAVDVVKRAASEVNKDRNGVISHRGPDSKYVLEGKNVGIEFEVLGEPVGGLACKLDSVGFTLLRDLTTEVYGVCTPLADTGTLPLVADLQDAGFDLQTIGYGVEDAYHADNECKYLCPLYYYMYWCFHIYGLLKRFLLCHTVALISEFVKGFRVLSGKINISV